jgi:hypothetical protein
MGGWKFKDCGRDLGKLKGEKGAVKQATGAELVNLTVFSGWRPIAA